MLSPFTYSRSPRLNQPPPKDDINIPGPPAKPTPPRSLWPIIIPPALMAVAMMVVAWFMDRLSMMAFSAPLILISGVAGVAAAWQQRREYHKEMRAREDGYRDMLTGRRDELQAQQDKQLKLLEQKDPPPRICLEWVSDIEPNRSMWARSPADADFLEIRLGLGQWRSTIEVKPPNRDHPFAPDPLIIEAEELASSFKYLPDAPFSLHLRQSGVVGLAGSRLETLQTIRAIVMQLAFHHSPDEVKLIAIYPETEKDDWAWLRWLPHVWNDNRQRRFLASDAEAAHQLLFYLDNILSRRRHQGMLRTNEELPTYSPCFVFLLAAPNLVKDEPLITLLQNEGSTLGAYPIFIDDRIKRLPQKCRAIIDLAPTGAKLGEFNPDLSWESFVPDPVPREMVYRFARAMAPIRLNTPVSMEDLPAQVTLLEIFKVTTIEELNILERWEENKKRLLEKKSMAVPIGRRAGGELLKVDLHELAHGPNGLVAGMVGKGKSELLQTLVASLAIHFHPHQVAFVLIDYKGDATTRPFINLPHSVGIINNLQEGSLIKRALHSLNVEINRRKRLFSEVDVIHIDEYQKRYYRSGNNGELKPLPYLVIIVDEFAELQSDRPEDAEGFVHIARVGRSLGLRLILAMQKPGNIVKDQIEANTRFRLCLQVANAEDSRAMLKRDDAARLSVIGRAYFMVGLNEVFELFQVAYSGAAYDPDNQQAADPLEIIEVDLNGFRRSLYSPNEKKGEKDFPRQLDVLVNHLKTIAESEKFEPLPPLWLPPLPPQLFLDDKILPVHGNEKSCGDLNPVIGRLDDRNQKKQPLLHLNLGQEGHLRVYGASGQGKTTFIQTLVMSLALSYSPDEANLYLVDLTGRLLTTFEQLPHVGGVIVSGQEERFGRLLDYLLNEIDSRQEAFGEVRAADLYTYRRLTGQSMPALVVVIDSYDHFAEIYKNDEATQSQLLQIITDGRSYGIHLVLTASSALSIPIKVYNKMNLAVALYLKERSDYSTLLGPTAGLIPTATPGRGLIKIKEFTSKERALEFQTALPARDEIDLENPNYLITWINQICQSWPSNRKAKCIPELPKRIFLDDLLASESKDQDEGIPADSQTNVRIGQDVENLNLFTISLTQGPNFLIAGPLQSGKTNLLLTWLSALARCISTDEVHLYVFDSQRRGLSALEPLPHCHVYISKPDSSETGQDQQNQTLQKLRDCLTERQRKQREQGDAAEASIPKLLVIVDDIFDPSNDATSDKIKQDLFQLMQQGRNLGLHLLIAGTSSDLVPQATSNNLIKTLKSQGLFILGNGEDETRLGLPHSRRDKPLGLGEGYWVQRGRARKIKLALAPKGTR